MPFVPVNCGALSENLVESELFGHRKGAFTGADRDHKGLFEVANGGTLFLDEVGELNKNIQVKLLRFLESGEIRRVGDTEPFRTDVRVLCATNRDLRDMIQEDEFREDLYFRINTFEIRLPPLRERRPDIPDLARHLLARAARRPVEQVADLLTPEAIDALLEYDWPGNVRELANVMEHAYILSGGSRSRPEHLPDTICADRRRRDRSPARSARPTPPAAARLRSPRRRETLKEIEMEHILRVLEKHNGNKPAAAAELGIVLKTLYNKLNAAGRRTPRGGVAIVGGRVQRGMEVLPRCASASIRPGGSHADRRRDQGHFPHHLPRPALPVGGRTLRRQLPPRRRHASPTPAHPQKRRPCLGRLEPLVLRTLRRAASCERPGSGQPIPGRPRRTGLDAAAADPAGRAVHAQLAAESHKSQSHRTSVYCRSPGEENSRPATASI